MKSVDGVGGVGGCAGCAGGIGGRMYYGYYSQIFPMLSCHGFPIFVTSFMSNVQCHN